MTVESWASSAGTRRSMKGNRSKNTSPEVAIRRRLHASGLRYRLHVALLAGSRRSADIVFPRQRVAVFVDGCYWHGCPEHYTVPRANAAFWRAKVQDNRARDLDTTSRFQEEGWTVLRVWEHESPEQAASRIEQVVRSHPPT